MNKFCQNGFFQLVTPKDLLFKATSSEPMKSKVFSIQAACKIKDFFVDPRQSWLQGSLSTVWAQPGI